MLFLTFTTNLLLRDVENNETKYRSFEKCFEEITNYNAMLLKEKQKEKLRYEDNATELQTKTITAIHKALLCGSHSS